VYLVKCVPSDVLVRGPTEASEHKVERYSHGGAIMRPRLHLRLRSMLGMAIFQGAR